MSKKLFEKEKAPTFKLKRDGNNYIDTSTLKNPYIVYFYPKDDTPGCTIEAIDFSSNMKFFNQNNITIIGISKDTVEKHEKFITVRNNKIYDGHYIDKYFQYKGLQLNNSEIIPSNNFSISDKEKTLTPHFPTSPFEKL